MEVTLMIEGQEDVTWDDWVAIARACESSGVGTLFRSDHYLSVEDKRERGSLDAWAKEYVRTAGAKRKPRRVEDAVVAGKYNAWVVEDTRDQLIDNRVYGVMFLDGAWTIDFAFYEDGQPEPLTEQERQDAIESMLATFAPQTG